MSHRRSRLRLASLLLAACLPAVPALAAAARPAAHDRLFLSFVEDGTIVENQWWEGQLEFTDGDVIDATVLRGIVALRPWDDVEVGARVGFGSTDTPDGLPDGDGGTDLALWGKVRLNSGIEELEFTAGGIVTVPTGDDTAGLGFDAFSLAAFGAIRRAYPEAIVSAHLGLRLNGDGSVLGSPELAGAPSSLAGVGVIAPRSDRLSVVGELDFEGKRFEGGENDARLLGGVNWRLRNAATLRGALAVGLADGAPDMQATVGYAVRF